MGFIFDEFWVCVKGKAKKQKQKTKMGVGVSISAVFRFFFFFFRWFSFTACLSFAPFFFSPPFFSQICRWRPTKVVHHIYVYAITYHCDEGASKKQNKMRMPEEEKKLRWKSRIGRLCWASGWLCCHSSQKGFFHHKEKEGGERP